MILLHWYLFIKSSNAYKPYNRNWLQLIGYTRTFMIVLSRVDWIIAGLHLINCCHNTTSTSTSTIVLVLIFFKAVWLRHWPFRSLFWRFRLIYPLNIIIPTMTYSFDVTYFFSDFIGQTKNFVSLLKIKRR